jgi:hypothetical protein
MSNLKVAGMMRLAEVDQTKVGKRLMKLSIQSLADKVSQIYFLQIGLIDNDIIEFINNLPIKIKITNQTTNYNSGWVFKNNESLDDLYQTIDKNFDWILYPDADDLLPENILGLCEKADLENKNTIRLHFIECFGSENNIIEIKPGYPIGPHFKAIKPFEGLTFIGSDGFNEAKGPLNRYETPYCIRHLRYANIDNIKQRQKMNYFQSYFLEEHKTKEYKPNQTINYYYA